jgi:ribose-phosphate pyrophosphokinase
MVTHGLFTGTGWEELWSVGVRRILCTDSVPEAATAPPAGVTVFSLRPLLLEALKGRLYY